ITSAIVNENLIFDFATQYYYSHQVTDLKTFELTDADFNAFKEFLKSNNFTFETKTEKAFDDALLVAKEEALNSVIDTQYNTLLKTLNTYKSEAIDANKTQLMGLLAEEIVKRYFYREGMYAYYI